MDHFTRVSPAMEVRRRYTGYDVVHTLERATREYEIPRTIQGADDSGLGFVSKEVDLWAYANGVTLDLSRPGKPAGNALIEALNARVRLECSNRNWCLSLDDARIKIYRWREMHNHERPYSQLGYKTPVEFSLKRTGNGQKNRQI